MARGGFKSFRGGRGRGGHFDGNNNEMRGIGGFRTRGYSKQRGGRRGGRGGGNQQQPKRLGNREYLTSTTDLPYKISVQGFIPEDFTRLSRFLFEACPIPIKKRKISRTRRGEEMLIYVEHENEAQALVSMNGMMFENAQVAIKLVALNAGKKLPQVKQIPILAEYVQSRYLPDTKYLDLSSLYQAKELQACHTSFNSNSSLAQILFRCISDKCPGVESINFANNQMKTLSFFADRKLPPTVVNLSFEANSIASFQELDCLRGIAVKNLILADNPVQKLSDPMVYQSEIKRRFAELEMLDQEPVSAVLSFDVSAETKLEELSHLPYNTLSYQNDTIFELTVTFVKMFFDCYDNRRQEIARFYNQTSVASLTCHVASLKAHAMGKAKDVSDYTRTNRNHKIQTLDTGKRKRLLYVGPAAIKNMHGRLPQSQTAMDQLQVDSHLISADGKDMMLVNVVGTFEEMRVKTFRGFSRTFLLKQCDETPPPAEDLPIVIVNDQLHIYGVPKQAPTVVATPADQSQQQQAMITELGAQTNMVPDFCRQCLENSNWNFQEALSSYQNALQSGALAPEAFLPGGPRM